MKKLFAILLTVAMLTSMATIVSAAELTTTKSTTLTTTVPAATYTLNIPEDQKIEFGATETSIGNVTVTEATGFSEGKNVKLTVTYDEFKSEAVSTTIPFGLVHTFASSSETRAVKSGASLYFYGKESGTVTERADLVNNNADYAAVTGFNLKVNSNDWGKALAGDYTATITFTTEVVVE